MKAKRSPDTLIRRLFQSDTDKVGDMQTNLVKWVHFVGAAAAVGSSLFYLFVYLQTGAWQTLANSIGVALALLLTGMGYLSLLRGRPNLTVFFGLAAVITAFSPAELFWAEATIYNLAAGVILLILVTRLLQVGVRKWFVATTVYLGIMAVANIFEPFLRYNIKLSPALSFYIPLIAISLSLAITWQLIQVFRIGSIRTRLVIAFLTVTIIPLILLAVVNNRLIQATLIENANQSLLSVASESAATVDDFISTNLQTVNSESQISSFAEFLSLPISLQRQEAQREPIQISLRTLHQKDISRIRSYALLDHNGINVIDSIPMNVGHDESQTEYFQSSFLEGITFSSEIVFDQDFTGEGFFAGASIYFSAPIIGDDSDTLGVLRIQFDGSVLQDIIRRSNDTAGEESFGVMFQEAGGSFLHIAHGTAPETLYTTLVEVDDSSVTEALVEAGNLPALDDMAELSMELPELQQHLTMLDEEVFFSATDVATGDRINQVAVLRVTNKPNWIIAFFQPQDIFLSAAQQQSTISVILLVIISALVAGVAMVLSQIFSRPIIQLTEVAQQVASGDLTAKAEIDSEDEFGILAATFNSMTEQLTNLVSGLEETVSDRTADLERRAIQMETAAEVAREAAAIRDLQELLDQVSRLISERFGFYHTGIFLIDDTGEYAVLQSSNSEGGQRMLARGHKLQVGKVGVVGYSAGQGEPRIAQDVGADVIYYDNPDMPATRSEMALPLVVRNQVIGVLDVQSELANAFSTEDVQVLQTLADQIALAIENTRLFQSSQDALEELEYLYGREIGQAWKKRIENRPSTYSYSRTGRSQSPNELPANSHENQQIISKPIIFRGHTIGSLDLMREADQNPWSANEISLIEEIIDQTALALESARLSEQIRLRSDQIQLLQEVTALAASTLDEIKLLDVAAQKILVGFSLLKCSIVLFEPEGKSGTVVANAALNPLHSGMDIDAGSKLNTNNELTLEMIRSKKTSIIYDVRNDIQATAAFGNLMPDDAEALALVPMIIRDEVIGMISLVISEEDRRLSAEDLNLLYQISRQISGAIDIVHLFEAEQEARQEAAQRAEREHLVASITAKVRASNDPQAIIQIAIAELRQVLTHDADNKIVESSAIENIDLKKNNGHFSDNKKEEQTNL